MSLSMPVVLQHVQTSSSTANQYRQRMLELSDFARSPESPSAVSIRAMSDPVYSSDTVRMTEASLLAVEANIQEMSEQTECILAFQLAKASCDVVRGSFSTLANESQAHGRKMV